MKRYTVVVTPFAADNIREVHSWLAAENPVHAARWLDGIRDKILGLETFPEAHPVAPESAAFDREIDGPSMAAERNGASSSPSRGRRFTSCMSGTVGVTIGVRKGDPGTVPRGKAFQGSR